MTSNAQSGSAVTARVTWSGTGEQRVYYLTHDSIENFLHQKRRSLTSGGNLLGWLGVLVTIILTLNTATFSASLGMSAETVKGVFIFAALASVVGALKEAWSWLTSNSSPEQLAEDLGRRGIRPTDLIHRPNIRLAVDRNK